MADENIKVICDREDIVAIADAIRAKTDNTDEMTLAQMPGEIEGITSGSGEVPENVVTCDLEGATEDDSTVPLNADTLGGFLPSVYAKNGGKFYNSGWSSNVNIPQNGTVTNVASVSVPAGIYIVSAQLICSGAYEYLYIKRNNDIITSKSKVSNNDLVTWIVECTDMSELSIACRAWTSTTAEGALFACSIAKSESEVTT